MARRALPQNNPADAVPALRVLAKSGALSDLQGILTYVSEPDPALKKLAVDTASNIIRRHLLTRYDEVDAGVREKLGTLLSSLSSSVVDELSEDLYHDEEARRVRAVQILGLLKKNPRVRDILAKLVQDRNVRVRATAVNLLGKVISFGDRDNKELILSLLNDKDKRVRANTIEALEALGNKGALPILLRFKNDPNNRIRGNVFKALYGLGYKEIQGDLLKMITSSDTFMKASAMWVIAQTKLASTELEDAIGYCLLADNDMVLTNARKALEAMATPRAQGYVRYLTDAAIGAAATQ
jgi:HEAT repeat protein